MKILKHILFIPLSVIILSSCGSHGHSNIPESVPTESPTNFPTVGFQQRHEVEIPFNLSDVYPLFEPQNRHLIYDWWEPTILKEGSDQNLKGQVSMARVSSHDIYLIVTEHNPEEKSIKYMVLWDDFELQRIQIKCEEGSTNKSTKITWIERNAGIHENGVEMVSEFVEKGHLVAVMNRYAAGIEDYLNDKL